MERLTGSQFDLLVIGGGITGAGIALDAASRGLSVALIEKQDFAAGTSSRSTKLVHGGLRYLEHLELGLVHKAGREREILHQNASHLVIPEKMLLPIIEDGTLGEFTTSLALYVYDYLAGVKKREHRRMLTREETTECEPLLNADILKGGALYYEYRTDDSRLTMEVIKKAAAYGAVVINYVEAMDFIYHKRRVQGAEVKDVLTGDEYSIYGKYTVNATGVWVDQMRSKDNSLKNKRLHVTKGIHVVVSRAKFPLKTAMYFDVGDRRMIFAIPRDRIVYIGTTDTEYFGALENPDITRADIEYLLSAVQRIAPSVRSHHQRCRISLVRVAPSDPPGGQGAFGIVAQRRGVLVRVATDFHCRRETDRLPAHGQESRGPGMQEDGKEREESDSQMSNQADQAGRRGI